MRKIDFNSICVLKTFFLLPISVANKLSRCYFSSYKSVLMNDSEDFETEVETRENISTIFLCNQTQNIFGRVFF